MKTRLRLRKLLIAVAVAALLMSGVEVRPYPASVVSDSERGGDLYWWGHLFASAAKLSHPPGSIFASLSGRRAEYRVTLGTYSTNVEITVRMGQ